MRMLRFGTTLASTQVHAWTVCFPYGRKINKGAPRKMPAKILIVDDSSTTLLMEEMLLKKYTNFDVVQARNGQEAVETAMAENPDLILMDVIMPKMDGFAACREMRRQEKLRETPIILVTSRGEPENVETGFESGCSDYLTKPIESQELIQMVNGYLAAEKAR
jgi:CheY-like chemotaxis protein